jgi:PAS domain S-box-containing protein
MKNDAARRTADGGRQGRGKFERLTPTAKAFRSEYGPASFDSSEPAGRSEKTMSSIRRGSKTKPEEIPPAATAHPTWLRRLGCYGLALLLVATGVPVRTLLTRLVGSGLPTYMSFYPLVMLAALIGGWGPGLLAILTAAVAADYWLLPPQGLFKIENSVDLVGLAFFCTMGLLVSLVAELYRRTRDHLEELVVVRTAALSQANEQLRAQAEELRVQTEELAAANVALRESEDKFKAIFYRAALGLAITDPTGRILDCNLTYQEMFDYTKGELQHKRFLDITHPDDVRKDSDLHRRLNEGLMDSYRLEKRCLRRDGRVIWCHVIASAIRDPDGAPKYNMAVVENITRRKQTEEALRVNEARFRALVQNSSDNIVLFDGEGTVMYQSPSIERLLGYRPEERIGRNVFRDPIVHPDDQAAKRTFFEIARSRRGTPVTAEFRLRHADGSWRYVEAVGQSFLHDPGVAGIVANYRDITERRLAEEALRQSETCFRILTTNLSSGVALIDEDGKFALYNPAFLTMFGLAEDSSTRSVNDHNWGDWQVFEEDGTLLDVDDHPVRKAVLTGQAVRNKLVGVRLPSGGALRWMLISAEPVPRADGHRAIICTYHDVSERKVAEEALRELNATLESKVAQRTEELEHRAWQLQKLTLELTEAEERERARIAEILHEDLQQVLAAAKFQVGLLGRQVKNNAEARETVGQATNLLVAAIAKSRSLSHELSSPALAQTNLCAAFEWLVRQMRAEHGFTVHLETEDRLDVASEPLRLLLYKAAHEMLFNVIKHAGVTEARLRLRRQRGRLRLSVSDRGRGFDPTDPAYKLGFGLLSVRERIELLGGRLTVRSAPGKGSTFFVAIPDSEARKRLHRPSVQGPD